MEKKEIVVYEVGISFNQKMMYFHNHPEEPIQSCKICEGFFSKAFTCYCGQNKLN